MSRLDAITCLEYLDAGTTGELVFVTELVHGENNKAYLYKNGSGEFFVGRRKNALSKTPSLLRERQILQFLQQAGLDFAPRSVAFIPEI